MKNIGQYQNQSLSKRKGSQVMVNAFPRAALGDDVRELQSQTQEELDALMPSILDKAFKGEL